MDTEQSERVRRYMVLKVMEKRDKAELDDLKPQVLRDMLDYNGAEAKISGATGKLSIQARDTWTYPPSVEELRATLKEEEKNAKRDGTATATVSHNLLFKEAVEQSVVEEEPLKV